MSTVTLGKILEAKKTLEESSKIPCGVVCSPEVMSILIAKKEVMDNSGLQFFAGVSIVVDPEMNNDQVDVYRDTAAFNDRVKMIESKVVR